jgi:hypothetical protein
VYTGWLPPPQPCSFDEANVHEKDIAMAKRGSFFGNSFGLLKQALSEWF